MGRTLRTVRAGESKSFVPGETGTTAETIPNYGVTYITADTTSATTYVLGAPSSGVRKTLIVACPAGSAAVTVRGSVGTDVKFGGSNTQVAFTSAQTAVADLVGVNSTSWQILYSTSATAGTS